MPTNRMSQERLLPRNRSDIFASLAPRWDLQSAYGRPVGKVVMTGATWCECLDTSLLDKSLLNLERSVFQLERHQDAVNRTESQSELTPELTPAVRTSGNVTVITCKINFSLVTCRKRRVTNRRELERPTRIPEMPAPPEPPKLVVPYRAPPGPMTTRARGPPPPLPPQPGGPSTL